MANYYNKDLYKILNLNFDSSVDEIKASYRKLVRIYHPDVAQTPESALKFKDIQEAYEILTNEEKRKKYDVLHGFYTKKIKKDYEKQKAETVKNKYDTYLKSARQKAKKDEQFSKSINDALDNLFYGKKLNSENQKSSAPVNGQDINLDLTISWLESINGTNRKVNILHTQTCNNCGGRKFINGAKCQMCNGTGEISLQKKINVKIPGGVTTGSKVRVKKEGNKGINGGKDGDLYLVITVEKHPYYEVDGLNILCNVPVTPFEAVLGTEVTLPLPDGNVTVKIPPLTSSGQKLKIASQGLENKSKNKRGDIIVTVLIKLPDSLSDEEKELYSRLKALSTFDIRKDFKNAK